MIRLLSVLLWGGLLGCSGTEAKPECVDNGECPAGNACITGKCKEVSCVSSADCNVQQFCNPEYECQDGCEKTEDCEAGFTCNKDDHTCEGYGCRSTELDCAYGEFCNPETGECNTRGSWCESCNENNLYSCGDGAYCIPLTTNGDGYCWNYCDNDGDCPRGFECSALGTGYENICFADCDFMKENGYL